MTTCGTDIIEIDRIKDSIEKYGQKFLETIYTKNEIFAILSNLADNLNKEQIDLLYIYYGSSKEYNNDWAVSETMYCLKVKPEIINPYYLMYVLYSVGAKEQFEPKISKGSVPHLKVSDLLDVLIPVPAIEVQKQIVDAVKNFDNLCLKLVAELNNEIEARSMQFEYYRDKLLSFENVQ